MNIIRSYSLDFILPEKCKKCGTTVSVSMSAKHNHSRAPQEIRKNTQTPTCQNNLGAPEVQNKSNSNPSIANRSSKSCSKKKQRIINRYWLKEFRKRELEQKNVAVENKTKKDIANGKVGIFVGTYNVRDNTMYEYKEKEKDSIVDELQQSHITESTKGIIDESSMRQMKNDEKEKKNDNDEKIGEAEEVINEQRENENDNQNEKEKESSSEIDANSLLVDLTQEDCWKQSKSKDKSVNNINKITRYGVGYKKCPSHNMSRHCGFISNGKDKYNNHQHLYSNGHHQYRNGHHGHHGHHGQCNGCVQNRRKPNVVCSNCGGYGHLYRNCNYPITSYGIICFRFKTDKQTDTITPEFLMVQRHKSLNYVEFMRGKWTFENKKYLMEMFENMTEEERSDIASLPFLTLWKSLWKVQEVNTYDREYRESKFKFEYLKKGYLYETKDGTRLFLNIDYIIQNTKSTITESEWGFPKGKRLDEKETDFDCAMREFVEETSIIPKYVEAKAFKPYEEVFNGSNKIRYKHVYYLAHCTTNNDKVAFSKDIEKVVDIDEIRNVKWFRYVDGVDLIRDPNPQRKDIFRRVHSFVMENLDVRMRSK